MARKKIKKMDVPDTFGARLRKSRNDKRLSQTELAVMLGYKHNGPVSTMESGKTGPDLQTLQRLSECLEIDLHWLITGHPTPNTVRIATAVEPCVLEFLSKLNEQIHHIEHILIQLDMAQRFRGEDNQPEIDSKTKDLHGLTDQYGRLIDAMKNAGRL